MKIGKYQITANQRETSLYQWVEAVEPEGGNPVILQVLRVELSKKDLDYLMSYFDTLQALAINRTEIWSPQQQFSQADYPLVLVYPHLTVTPLTEVLKQATKEEALKWWKKASESLHILHNSSLVHGYVSPDSFVVAGQNLYLTNFGYPPLLEQGNQQAFEECREFLAPEVLQQQGLLLAADIYAFAKTVGSCHPQMTGTSWYSQATKPNPDQRLKGIRTSFTALERAFKITFGLNNPKKPEPPPNPNPEETTKTDIIPKHLLDVTVEPPDGGLVITDNSTYLANKVATVTATASSGWQFEGWSGDLSGTENPAKVRMDGDKAIVANFIGVPSSRELIVSPSGAGHYRTISEAIRIAPVNATIRVMPGVYRESLVLDKAVEILGMGTVEEIIVENTDAPCLLMQTESASVLGLTLRGRAGLSGNKHYAVDIPEGELILEGCDITSDSLACVAIHGSQANPTISNCQIHDGKEGGIYVFDQGQGRIENCDIYSNTGAGVWITKEGTPVIFRCQIHDQVSHSGIYIDENGLGQVKDCDIFGNAYAGVFIKKDSNPLIQGCRIHDGKQRGILVAENGKSIIINCNIFSNNMAGVEIKIGANPTIRNCQIHDGKDAGIFVNDKGQGIIENCTISGNALTGIKIHKEANPTIRDCKIDHQIDDRKPEPQPRTDERSQQQKEAEERQRREAERLRQQKQEKERQHREAERLQKQTEKQVKVVTSFIGLFLATTTLGWFFVPVESWTLIANFPMPFRNYLILGILINISSFPAIFMDIDKYSPEFIKNGGKIIFIFLGSLGVLISKSLDDLARFSDDIGRFLAPLFNGLSKFYSSQKSNNSSYVNPYKIESKNFWERLFENKEFFSNNTEQICRNVRPVQPLSPDELLIPKSPICLNPPCPRRPPSGLNSPLNSTVRLNLNLPSSNETSCYVREIPNYQTNEWGRVSIYLIIIVILTSLVNLVIFGILSAILKDSLNNKIKVQAIFTAFLGLVIGWQVHHSL